MHRRRILPLLPLFLGPALLAGCDNFDKDQAALQIQKELCRDWPYGCTSETRVEIEKVNKTRNGRQVKFRIIDRADETPTLSAAYFEPRDDEWQFLLFEEPFNGTFKELAGRVADESRRFTDELMELKAAQKWFLTIYGRYARSLAELDSVSYKPPDEPIEMTLSGGSWRARIASPYVICDLDVSSQPLPECSGLPARSAGTDRGPLSEAFGSEQ